MESVIKVIFGSKILGLVLFVVVLVISFAYTLAVGPDDPESNHGYTAVCGDGTVLEPPWNQCGKEHSYLDHWTTGPAATATETISEGPSIPSVPSEAMDDLLRKTSDTCTKNSARGEVPRDHWTPCGQLLGYFDDWTPSPRLP